MWRGMKESRASSWVRLERVMVVASAAVQENFRSELFQMKRVKIDEVAGTLESKQCTGRRYLDMLLRIESEPANWNNPRIRDKLERTADKMISEFSASIITVRVR